MKKVIFICMLSFSLCFSQLEQEKGQTPKVTETKPTNNAVNQPPMAATEKNAAVDNTQTTVATPMQSNTNTSEKVETVTKPATTNETATSMEATITVKPANPTEKAVVTSSTTAAPTTSPTPAHKEEKITNITTTTTPVPVKTSSTPPTPTLQARSFDGPSFIGGMILTLGLLAVGFMGFKYYKNQTERNYHTL